MPRQLHSYAVTIPRFTGSRENTRDFLSLSWPNAIERYVIAEERHVDGALHQHIWILFHDVESLSLLADEREMDIDAITTNEPTNYDSVTQSFRVWAEKGLNVQSCKSSKSWIRYITKEDKDAILFNVEVNECSLFYQTNYYARQMAPRWNHPFAVAHMNMGNVLNRTWREAHNEYAELAICKLIPFPLPAEFYDFPWKLRAIRTINKYLNHPVFKQPHLYIYGIPNTGKSTFVNDLIELMNWRPCFPLKFKSPFWLGQVNDAMHHVLIFDDFQFEDYTKSDMLNLLQGGWMSIQRKHEDAEEFRWRKPIIITSNVHWNDLADPLKARLRPIHAPHTYREIINEDEDEYEVMEPDN